MLLSQLRTQLGTGLELHEFGALVNNDNMHWRAALVAVVLVLVERMNTVSHVVLLTGRAFGISRAFHWGFEDGGLLGGLF